MTFLCTASSHSVEVSQNVKEKHHQDAVSGSFSAVRIASTLDCNDIMQYCTVLYSTSSQNMSTNVPCHVVYGTVRPLTGLRPAANPSALRADPELLMFEFPRRWPPHPPPTINSLSQQAPTESCFQPFPQEIRFCTKTD